MTFHSRLCALSSFRARVLSTPLSPRVWADHGCSRICVAAKTHGDKGRSSNVIGPNGIRAYNTGQDLSSKKCVPCESKDLRAMTEDAANILIRRVPEWTLENDNGTLKLHRSWKVKTFVKGMEFLRLVADLAEAEGHHPDLHLVGWNNVKIDIWTHAVGKDHLAFSISHN
ncbi:transcriptional coactivator/pterin dehydratase [Striga asiatica]|uniref:4a-hydroxytetrahydrobiopterin dehydratase n=1 Tax=Striga asiatica TaxID=4170 RepID=A0A5A7P0D0_STRAF|nr:transcriptional coactivator/pterin dehydratase [Striga asiatica]